MTSLLIKTHKQTVASRSAPESRYKVDKVDKSQPCLPQLFKLVPMPTATSLPGESDSPILKKNKK